MLLRFLRGRFATISGVLGALGCRCETHDFFANSCLYVKRYGGMQLQSKDRIEVMGKSEGQTSILGVKSHWLARGQHPASFSTDTCTSTLPWLVQQCLVPTQNMNTTPSPHCHRREVCYASVWSTLQVQKCERSTSVNEDCSAPNLATKAKEHLPR